MNQTAGHTALLRTLLGVLLAVVLGVPAAWADGFKVVRAHTTTTDSVIRLDARLEFDFTPPPLEALRNGVPLTIEVQIEVLRAREWAWDETIASVLQRYRLEYHALARQFVVFNLNSGELRSFPTRNGAIEFMGRIQDFPLLDRALLVKGGSYYGRLRTTLDIESLPPPLRPLAYLSSDWRLSSPWYAWSL